MSQDRPAIKIKNGHFPLFVLHVLTPDLEAVKQDLQAQLAQSPGFLVGAPLVLGLGEVAELDWLPDFAGLAADLAQLGLPLAGVLGGSPDQREAARAARLGLFPDKGARARAAQRDATPVIAEPPAEASAAAPPAPVAEENVAPPANAPRATLIIDKPVRTGQRIHAEGADLVVLAIVNPGAELIADGDIHVYAPLRGRALAGARGNHGARIFALSMEAELVSIAGLYQVFEEGVPQALRGKPVQVLLEGEQLTLRALAAMR